MSVLEHVRKQTMVPKVNDLARAMGVHPLTILTLAYLKADEISTVNELQQIVGEELITIGKENK